MALIEIKNLDKIYNTTAIAVHAVNDVSLTIDKKEFTATVSKMGRHKMITVPAKNPIKPGDQVTVSPRSGVGRTKPQEEPK